MRLLVDMDTIQIEITNACHFSCSNCTRFCGHHRKPYFMEVDRFKEAVDSMGHFPKMTGIMGGEPLLHPRFEELCDYAASKIPKERLGLWSSFPKGKESHREAICRTFGNIFLNDHTRGDIYHCPILVAGDEVCTDRDAMFIYAERCWLQNSWSASINPKGAFFCEIAASMSILFGGNSGWEVEPRWWLRTPKDYREQIEEYCPKCGCAFNLPRRLSIDGRDDISPGNLERLKGSSRKIDAGKYVVSDLKWIEKPEPMASYKDKGYRDGIAARYGIFLVPNRLNFLSPHLKDDRTPFSPTAGSLFERFQAEARRGSDA